jgi:hypothetical protein
MEEYLIKLKKTIFDKDLEQFCVFPDLKTFKIIKKSEKEMVKIMKEKPEKYAGRQIAIILLQFFPDGFKKNKDVFGISIRVCLIEKNGSLTKNTRNISSLYIRYRPHELEKHPFKIKNLEKMIKWVQYRYVESNFMGIFYDELEVKLDKLKELYTKKKV